MSGRGWLTLRAQVYKGRNFPEQVEVTTFFVPAVWEAMPSIEEYEAKLAEVRKNIDEAAMAKWKEEEAARQAAAEALKAKIEAEMAAAAANEDKSGKAEEAGDGQESKGDEAKDKEAKDEEMKETDAAKEGEAKDEDAAAAAAVSDDKGTCRHAHGRRPSVLVNTSSLLP
jgi:hypothetical protein